MRHGHFLKLLLAGALALPMLAGVARANPVILFDLQSGKILEHQDAFKRWYPASLSKLMTAYVTF
ncbi:D-alanyl-D-alanine carboxypeptidase, partial [Mesorhizobium sp. M4B.F.Ca.ET.088.02.2.1]